MNFLPQNLLFLRKQRGLSQSEIQAHTGFKRNTWSNWETGVSEPSIENLIIIAQLFDITVGELITNDFQNVGDSGKSRQKINPKIVGDNVGNNVGDGDKNYKINDLVSHLADEGENKRQVFVSYNSEDDINTFITAFKDYLTANASQTEEMREEIKTLWKKVDQLTQDQGKK